MELRHKGVSYQFEYDFAPSDETGQAWTRIDDEHGLDGSIHVHSITVNGRSRPVTTGVLTLMQHAAAIEEFARQHRAWIDLYRRAGVPVPAQWIRGLEAVSRLRA